MVLKHIIIKINKHWPLGTPVNRAPGNEGPTVYILKLVGGQIF